jgi:two-component system, response regulator RegA
MDDVDMDIGARLSSTEHAQPYYADMGRCENADVLPASPLLLVDDEAGTRNRMRIWLTASNFAVTSVRSADEALDAADESAFSHAVVELRIGRDSGLRLIPKLSALQRHMRIVVVTGYDSFASVILALRAGAVDYLSKPVDPRELVCALRGEASALPLVPEMPLGVDRVAWEHTQRIFEQCDRCVTQTAKQLGMHRRTLQRILLKRSPQLRRHSN